ncbi:RCC1/BLIP-II [Marasmius fiardii PR-910]|nr:RCC1/BLIP-II [Marasmius fiardii PR-910]
MPRITDLPVELHIDVFLPLLPLKDLLSLSCTNKHFAVLCNDNTFWKRKLDRDFNFNGANTARTAGWKFIYLRLTNPRVYVWGNQENGRLGLSKFPKSALYGVPFPTELHFPGIRIVDLAAGGMSFHALDAEGHVHVWGTLDGSSFALNSDGFSEPSKSAPTPLRLELPNPTRSISCGRLHSLSLDSKNFIWNFLCWGRPFKLLTHLFNSESPVIQIECGWAFSSALTKSGDIFVWWPFSGNLKTKIDQKMSEMDSDGDKKAVADEGVIPCHTWEIEADPVGLPSLPPLPDLPDNIKKEETRVIQIAAYDNHIIALTNNGHVLMFDSLDGEDTVSNGRWRYLPKFSDVREVRAHPTFAQGKATPPSKMQITHVSAHFRHFIAYSTDDSSIVLMGDMDTASESEPKALPELQNRGVISVVLGDYHTGALTADGKLLTWGAFSHGALGLGDPVRLEVGSPGGYANRNDQISAREGRAREPPAVEVPTEVRFDHKRKKPKERFCVSAAASGWHMGALVIDLEVCGSLCSGTDYVLII